MPKITIIVPVYNTAPFLSRCLDSVCEQSLRELEIICVNDASSDNSLAILRGYAARDNRITLIDLSHNTGSGGARNAAMAIAQGEFLGFVDSDDAIDMQFYEKLYDKAKETNATVVKGEMQRVAINGLVDKMPLNEKIRQNKFAFTYQFTTAIYNTRFIRENGIDFPFSKLAQDIAFLCKAVCLNPHVETVDGVNYRYFQRAGSAITQVLDLKKTQDFLKAPEDIVRFINARPIDNKAYDAFFKLAITICCHSRFTRSQESGIAQMRARMAIKLYSVCLRRDALDAALACDPRNIHIYGFLKTADSAGLARWLCLSPMQRIAAGLRARL